MRGSYIWGMGQQRPPHGSKYKLKLGGEEELGKRSLEGCGYQETGCVVARWGEPCSEASGALRLGGGEQTATTSRDTHPPAATRKACPPAVFLPSGCTSLEVAGSVKCQLDQRLLIPLTDSNSQIPVPPYRLKSKIQFTDVQPACFVRGSICCVM